MPKAIVASSSRKYVRILNEDNLLLPGVLVSKDLSTIVGDEVIYELQAEKQEVLVNKILPRKNLLCRSSNSKTKELASNIDLLIVVTAPKPLFNKVFINRVMATASAQNIKTLILVNKSDLKNELAETYQDIEIYKKIGFSIAYSNTREADGLNQLEAEIALSKICCFIGISGVGKSSIINKLCPEQEIRVDDVSFTGQGKQTTTVAHAYRYPKNPNLLLVDLPGIQNFGIMHLDQDNIKAGFPEIASAARKCKFSDCSHIQEPGCNVKQEVLEGGISETRYESYLQLIKEIKETNSWS